MSKIEPNNHINLATVDFCTLGMFIIDEIHFEAPNPPVKDIIGGAGSYAVVGARMVAGREHCQSVSWIVDTGSDFPDEVRRVISSWDTSCIFRESTARLTTRAWNGYGPNEKRDFKYLTPKIRLDHNSLSESQVFSKTFHMVCSPARCIDIVEGILERRNTLLQNGNIDPSLAERHPIFVWEPVPDLCREEELPTFYKALKYVDVLSPNELELGSLYGNKSWSEENPRDREIADAIVKSGIGPDGKGLLVVRAGKDGCYAFCQDLSVHIPACQGVNVVDPTGAGNAFLGALAQALITPVRAPVDMIPQMLDTYPRWRDISGAWGEDGRIPAALMCATVAASFVIEQIGMPRVSVSEEGKELWNGESYIERIRLYIRQFAERPEK
ncbi:hypothetical protein FQN50_007510 [Emmonsiellopsis sp. PD_5]|nr:hypothetical protein FQN50_007510 [Emmonsiellopsis sp. PD_5]